MFQLSEWKADFSKLLGDPGCLGVEVDQVGSDVSKYCESSKLAQEYLTHLVPDRCVRVPPFRFFDLLEIKENLTGLCYSGEFQELGFLPIGELDNDKLVCIDGEFPGFVVLQLGMGTIQPIRRYMLFRCCQFSDFLKYVAWQSGKIKLEFRHGSPSS